LDEAICAQKIKPYGMNVSDGVETNWTTRAVVSAFAVIALACFYSPSLQTLRIATTPVQHHQEQFNHKGKISFCLLAKAPAKIGIRKSSTQQPVHLFYSAGDVSLHRLHFSARSLCERAPPV
jgi:hypothetical protein